MLSVGLSALPAACSKRPPAADSLERRPAEAAPVGRLEGVWDLRTALPERPQAPAFQITLIVDSLTESGLHGRLAHFSAGNLGADPAGFDWVSGLLEDDSVVAVTIGTADDPPATFTIRGALRGDTIAVSSLTVGQDTIGSSSERWYLVRRPPPGSPGPGG